MPFHLTRPAPARIDAFLEARRTAAFSYAEVGGTRTGPAPAGYRVDRNRVRLGSGESTFRRAVDALHAWRMTALGWASVHPARPAIAPGTAVAMVVRHYGVWTVNPCRIVYVLDEEADGVRRVAFANGTLAAHGAVGEERFSVEWHQADDGVWYDLYAFSRLAHPLARLAPPLARRLQRRFARDSLRAMSAAVSETAARAP